MSIMITTASMNQKMINLIILMLSGMFLLAGCASLPDLQPKPEDYIFEQDISSVWDKLNSAPDHDYFVWYQGGTQALTSDEKVKLMDWIEAQQPEMICLRGTGGSEEFRALGENRVTGVIEFLQTQKVGIEIVKLDYDPSIRGGRVLVTNISSPLIEEIKSTAPILVIKSD